MATNATDVIDGKAGPDWMRGPYFESACDFADLDPAMVRDGVLAKMRARS